MKTFKGVVLGIIIAVLIVFAFMNSHATTVKLAGDKASFGSPLWAVVYVSFILGVIFGFLVRWRRKPKKSTAPAKPANTANPVK